MATPPVYRTWVAGEVVTAAYFNANVRDAGNFWLSVPTFEGRQTVAQSTTTAVAVPINLDTEDLDNDNGHSTVSNTSRYTAQTAGRFQYGGGVAYATNATGSRHAEVWKNGVGMNGEGTANGANAGGQPTRQGARLGSAPMNGSSDYLEMVGFQTSGGALNTDIVGVSQPTFSVRWVGTT